MQDHSHKLLFLGLTGLMSIAALYGSEAGPTLLVGTDGSPPARSASLTSGEASASQFAAKLAPDTSNCLGSANDSSTLCAATSKISLFKPLKPLDLAPH